MLRFRPITVTAVLGGLFFSHLLTIYTTRVIYLYVDRLRLRWVGFSERYLLGRPRA